MKKIIAFFFAIMAIFSSCQQDALWENSGYGVQTRSSSDDNTFTFYNSYIYWMEGSYMLDYSILGLYSNPPLDAEIKIPYRVSTDTGYSEIFYITIPAGSTAASMEVTTLGEYLIDEMGLDRYYHHVESVTALPYIYSGNMTIVGLDNLNRSPEEVYPPAPPVTIYPPQAEWTEVTYELNCPLKDIRYINTECGIMDACYTLCTTETLVMKVILKNTNNKAITYKYTDFCMMSSNRANLNPYRKSVTMHSENSYLATYLLNTFTLQAGESKIIYVRTGELFKEGEGKYDYGTNPPYYIGLYYKDSEIVGDYIDVAYSTRMEWKKY